MLACYFCFPFYYSSRQQLSIIDSKYKSRLKWKSFLSKLDASVIIIVYWYFFRQKKKQWNENKSRVLIQMDPKKCKKIIGVKKHFRRVIAAKRPLQWWLSLKQSVYSYTQSSILFCFFSTRASLHFSQNTKIF